MSCLTSHCQVATGAPPPGGDPADDAWRRFLFDGSQRARLLIEVNAADISAPLATVTPGDPWCSLASCSTAGGSLARGQKLFLFGDGSWLGRPTDFIRPNTMADSRITASADIDRSVALAPEATRRGEVSVGQIELANADGGLDDIVAGYTIGGRSIRLRLGPVRGDYASFQLVMDAFGLGWEGTHQSVSMRLQSTAAFLAVPLQGRSYSGRGGSQGDAAVAGRPIPSLWGECFNVSPVLLNQDQWIYQVHDGPIYAVDAVKERGLGFEPDGDVPDYVTLRTTDVAGGHYLTCTALGLVKVGLGVAGPTGPVTMDVRGDASSGGYTDTTGEILLRMALTRARIDGGLVNRDSFIALPRGRIGYYADGTNEVTVAQAFDDLLRPVLGFYGTARSAALTASAPKPPTELSARRMSFDTATILDIEDIGVEQPPRWAQAATYARNWTPMALNDISDAVDSDTRQRLQIPALSVRVSAGEVQQRDRSAIEGGVIDTLFAEQDAAQGLCEDTMDMFKETRRRFRVSVPRIGYMVDLGQVVGITYPRFGFRAGQNMLVTGVRDRGAQGLIDLTVWG